MRNVVNLLQQVLLPWSDQTEVSRCLLHVVALEVPTLIH